MGDTGILLEQELGAAQHTSDEGTQSTAEYNDSPSITMRPDEGERQILEEIKVHPAHSEIV